MEATENNVKLKEIGFCREGNDLSNLTNKGVISNKNLADKSINHTILRHTKIHKTNFDQASITGSIFDGCHFIGCSMVQADFEYCEFNGGSFKGKKPIISSFNNSNFIGVRFDHITFKTCTLTGAYFENCFFDGVKIEFTTMENAHFKNCTFQDMNLRTLNMDFVVLENPVMRNTVLPVSQICYMFGALQYCLATDDEVYISRGNGNPLTTAEFSEISLPVLKQHFIATNEWFPLCNICLALGLVEEVIPYLKKGLIEVTSRYDYRMIKFYCKLIAYSKSFSSHTLHGFYNLICRLNQGKGQNMETRNFVRNIGEIKELLFLSSRPTLNISFITNLTSMDSEKLGIVLNKLFSISKLKCGVLDNTAEFVLTENSPILIQSRINGEQENLQQILIAFGVLTNLACEDHQLSVRGRFPDFIEGLYTFREELLKRDIQIIITEYYTSFSEQTVTDGYFYNTKNDKRILMG